MRNQQLFSSVYLRELQHAKHAADRLEAALQTIREWREAYPSLGDPADRQGYVKQCLSALGVATNPRSGGDGFTLYADAGKAEPTGLCLTVADDDLGRAIKGAHPQAQLVKALRAASLNWGVITNGAQWRLCHAAAPAPYEVYLQADLDRLLASHSAGDFLLFHRFFGSEAFAAPGGQVGLSGFLAESSRRTEAVEKHLKGQVESVLQRLCLGFVDDEAAGSYDRDTLQVIYQNAIYLLYRILFLFYAEARDLLPLENERYQRGSLAAILEAARLRQQQGERDGDPFSLWKRLSRLFVVVDDGDAELDVAAYNGGLFSDVEKPYLKSHRIRDDFLASALFALGYETTKSGLQPIDYRDLSVRHLGTLYEGLLEYRLNRVEQEPHVVRESAGKRVFLPLSVAAAVKKGETILDVGQVYFADDKGERKSSGSYYTPEDVVQYIVANTVLPKLKERRQPLDEVLENVAREVAIAPTPDQRRQMERYADQEALRTVEQGILSLRILDPAMGSGHFLVAAAQMATDFIVETLNATDWPNETIVTDPLLWKRRVVERCLYGVDKNPLAQELAKLSLWIASASAGKPLTFLDLHLKAGNSLYGAPLSRLAGLPGSKKPRDEPLFRALREQTIRSALEELAAITHADSDTLEEVKRKGEAHQAARSLVERLRLVADVWLASLFGPLSGDRNVSDEEYARLLDDVTRNYAPDAWEARVNASPVLLAARAVAERERFLHWELEFPEAVVDGECRFDAVVANPPYVGTKANAAISSLYETAKCGDLYAWLFEKMLKITGDVGNVGTVVPMSIMFSEHLKSLRENILQRKGTARFASFDAHRDGLFPPNGGARNGQRATIAVLKSGERALRVETTNMVRFMVRDRPHLLQNLHYTDATPFARREGFPKFGDSRLRQFWEHVIAYNNTIGHNMHKSGNTPDGPSTTYYVFVPDTARYFITAMPFKFKHGKINSFPFAEEWTRDVAMVALNSNVCYWLWHTLGDGFDVTNSNVSKMVLPRVQINDQGTVHLRNALLAAAEVCSTVAVKSGRVIPNYNFNKRMDILLDIDEWIVRHVAPDLNLPRDIFAQYKSNSFMRPLDLSALTTATGAE